MARVAIQSFEQWRELAQRSKYCAAGVARELEISRRQLRRCTLAAFGDQPHHWLMHERLAAAAQRLTLLRSVKRVALEFGFKQVSHFSREFKLYYGLSPTAFLAGSGPALADARQPIKGQASSRSCG